MRFSTPKMLPQASGCTVHLDEFTNAPKQNQNLGLQIARERRVGEWTAPDGTFVILSGNGKKDRCHTERLSSAMANRVMFLHLVTDLDDWTQWALSAGLDVRIIAFLRFRPALLHNFDPAKWDGESGFGSPRSWEAVARLIATNPPLSLRGRMIEGLVGPGNGAEVSAFLTTYEKLPSIDAILTDPSGAPVPDDLSARYAVCAALAFKSTKGNFGRVLTYLGRMPKEFEVLGVRLGVKSKLELTHTRDFVAWAADNRDTLL
jgi:hypothetical protein